MTYNLKPGDLLYRSKGFVQHTGIYWGNRQVLHNTPANGVAITEYEQYSEGKTVKVVRTDIDDKPLVAERLKAIMASNSEYHLLANNCEHIAHLMITGRKSSPQIQATLIGAIAGVLIGSGTNKSHWLTSLICGGLAGCLLSNLNREYDAVIAPT